MIRLLYSVLMPFLRIFLFKKAKSIGFSSVHPKARLKDGVVIRNGCKIDRGVIIGAYTFINDDVRIDFNTGKIGNYCSISHGVKIGLGPHPHNWVSTSPCFYSKKRGFVTEELFDEITEKGVTYVGHDVLIGANAIILAGVDIGDGAVIGAGSVVTKNIPPYAIVAGIPAKVVKYRFPPEIISAIIKTKWWELSPKQLSEKKVMFSEVKGDFSWD